nr:hypothetical protein [Actinophytocola oryzae]
MPQVVNADLGQVGGGRDRAEPVEHRLGPQRFAVLLGEHEVVALVLVAPLGALDRLPGGLQLERLDHPAGQPDPVRRRHGLRLADHQPATDHRQGAADVHPAAVEVDIGPAHRERLTASQTAPGDHLEQRAEPVARRSLEEGRELAGRPRNALLAVDGLPHDVLDDVVRQAPLLHRVGERARQARQDAVHGDRATAGLDEILGEVPHVIVIEVFEPVRAERRDDVLLDVPTVVVHRLRLALQGFLSEPAGQVGGDRLAVVHLDPQSGAVEHVVERLLRGPLGLVATAPQRLPLAVHSGHINGVVPDAVLRVRRQLWARRAELLPVHAARAPPVDPTLAAHLPNASLSSCSSCCVKLRCRDAAPVDPGSPTSPTRSRRSSVAVWP